MRQFRLRNIKKKLLISSYIAIAMAFLGIGTYAIINVANTNAAEEDELAHGLDDDDWDLGVIAEDINYVDNSDELGSTNDPLIDPSEELPYTYNPTIVDNSYYNLYTKIENQRGEFLCWAYAYTSAIESYFSRSWDIENLELSPKQLDYLLSNRFSDKTNDNPNPYWDYLYKDEHRKYVTKADKRSISGGALLGFATAVSTGKNALVREETFWNKIKSNNTTINAFNGLNTYDQYLENNNNGYQGKITSGTVLNEENEVTLAEYNLVNDFLYYGEEYPIGAREIYNYYHEEHPGSVFSYDRERIIYEIKHHIDYYGSVAIGTHYNKALCGYTDSNNNFTIIDRTTRTNKKVCGSGTGHAITLVGWDNSWKYYDLAAGKWKQGAFIVQNSYGRPIGKEYFSYDSAITSFFALETAWPDNDGWWNSDHVYDYTDYKGHYQEDTSREKNYRLVYRGNENDTNTITPASNELIFEFETKGGGVEKLEWISLTQQFRMYGANFLAFISTDDGQTWRSLGWETFHYPGARMIGDGGQDVFLNGRFAIKVYYGKQTCQQVPANNEVGWESVCSNAQQGDYTGSALYDKEKIYDLISVHTTDVHEDVRDTYNLSFSGGTCDWNSHYKKWYRCVPLYHDGVEIPPRTSWQQAPYTIEVPRGSYVDIDNSTDTITITYPNGTITQIKAESDEDTYMETSPVSWKYYSAIHEEVRRDIGFSASRDIVRKKFNVTFQVRYENGSGGYTKVLYVEKDLVQGAMPVYTGATPTLESDEEGVTYRFIGWDKEIVPITEDTVYTAQFERVYPDGHTEPFDPDNPPDSENQGSPDVDKPDNGDNPGGSGSIDNPTPSTPGTTPSAQPTGQNGGGSYGGSGGSGSSGERVANTGYEQTDNKPLRVDVVITAAATGITGFVIYIIKNRRRLKKNSVSF